ncbi:MAG: Mu transposase C-terminal domain-containing protein [Gallionella sp.]|jgi:putative transposase
MSTSSFEKGVKILLKDTPHILRKKIDDELWQIEEIRTGRIKELKITELQRLYSKNELCFILGISGASTTDKQKLNEQKELVAKFKTDTAEWVRMKNIRQYVLAVKDLPTSLQGMNSAIKQLWERLRDRSKPPHWSTVARWKKKYSLSGNDIYSLKVKKHLRGNRKNRFPKEISEIIENAIEKIYLQRERKTIEDVLTEAITKTTSENKLRPSRMALPLPTRRAIKRVIELIPAFDRHAARYGQLAAIKKFRAVLHSNIADFPLERAEMDHTLLDLFVVDEETGIPWGRPWVTICIDSFTRCILGVHIGFEPPSYLTVARCLKHCFLPKVTLHEAYPDIKNTWEAHGVMSILVVDNGLEFHSESLDALCYSMGIDLQFTPRKTPWWKAKIERFNGTLNRNIAHGNPGTTFANIFEKDDYNPAEHALISLSSIKMVIHKWIVDVYHQRPHRSLDEVTPAIKWTSSIAIDEIKLPAEPTQLDALMGKIENRVLTHKGIEYSGLFYNSPELTTLRRRLGSTLDVELRVDEGDLGHIHVIAPDRSALIRVPCLMLDYANGITAWQHKTFKNYAAKQNMGIDVNSWRIAKVEIAEIIERDIFKASSRKKYKKGNKAAARHKSSLQASDESSQSQNEHAATNSITATNAAQKKTNHIPAQKEEDNNDNQPKRKSRPKFTAIIEERSVQTQF